MFACSISESVCSSKKNQEHCFEIISEYIFLEKRAADARKPYGSGSSLKTNLTVIQEFQLVLVFADFFKRPGPDVTRNAVFLCLFGSSSLTPGRSRVLSKFISTSISASLAPVSRTLTRET